MIPMYLKDIPIGPHVGKVVEEFDSDTETRYSILSGVFNNQGYILSREDVEEEFGKNSCLLDFISHVHLREQMAGLTLWLKTFVAEVRGEGAARVMFPEFEEHNARIHLLRSEWIRHEAIREATNDALKALAECMRWFNIQMVAGWIQRTLTDVLEQMEICMDFDAFEVPRQCSLLDDLAYRMGRSEMRSSCARAYNSLAVACESSPIFKDVVLLPPEKIVRLGQWRMGLIQDPGLVPEEKPEEDEDDYALNESGIFVPKKK